MELNNIKDSGVKLFVYILFNDTICIGLHNEVLSETSRTIIVVSASVEEDDRGGQGRNSASLLH
jgi:hypothetical protein